MEGKEAIIAKIMSDAETQSNLIEGDAEKKGEELIKEAKEWAKKYTSFEISNLNTNLVANISRRQTLAKLDLKKEKLRVKQEKIDQVFELAEKEIIKQGKKKFLALMEKLLNENAEKEDVVVLSKDKILTSEDITSLKVFSEKNLKISEETGDFDGGIKLIGKTCDKDLTVKSLINSIKEENVGKIAKILFD